jgi:hypothetical protein
MTDRKADGAGPSQRAPNAGGDGPAPGAKRRMSAKRKRSAVLRLLRGEDLELLSRGLWSILVYGVRRRLAPRGW